MKKISLILSMVLFTMVITSCETDATVEENTNFQQKTTFNAETTYWSILNNTESGMAQFDALTNEQKQAVWVFKYDLFIADNTLTTGQLTSVNNLKSYYSDLNWTEELDFNIIDSHENELTLQFDELTKDKLMLSLSNSALGLPQTSGQNQTEGCFGCWQVIPGSEGDCVAELDSDGNATGDYFFVAQVRRRYGFFRAGRDATAILGCDESEWDGGFGTHPF